MDSETIYESQSTQSRRTIASYFRRVADALEDGDPIPVDEDESVTVDPPEEFEMEVEVEREEKTVELELEMEWAEGEGQVDVDADASGSKATFEVYEDSAGKWRWRLRHDNGNIIADSGEGYTTKVSAQNGIESVKKNAPGGTVEEQ
jgi:amphi-Trp domain-containing protein